MLPHSKVWFAKRTKLFEPKITSITPITRNPTCCRTRKFGSRSEPNFPSPNVNRFIITRVLTQPARRADFKKAENEMFLRLTDLRYDGPSRHGLRANRTSRDMNNDKPTLLHSNPYNLFLQVWKLLKRWTFCSKDHKWSLTGPREGYIMINQLYCIVIPKIYSYRCGNC